MWYIDRIAAELVQEQPTAPDTTNDQVSYNLFDFTKYPEVLCSFHGPGPNLIVPSATPVPTWLIKILWLANTDMKGNNSMYMVPKWQAFDIPDANFKGFSNEKINDGSVYLLRYMGRAGADESNAGTVIMKILKREPA